MQLDPSCKPNPPSVAFIAVMASLGWWKVTMPNPALRPERCLATCTAIAMVGGWSGKLQPHHHQRHCSQLAAQNPMLVPVALDLTPLEASISCRGELLSGTHQPTPTNLAVCNGAKLREDGVQMTLRCPLGQALHKEAGAGAGCAHTRWQPHQLLLNVLHCAALTAVSLMSACLHLMMGSRSHSAR